MCRRAATRRLRLSATSTSNAPHRACCSQSGSIQSGLRPTIPVNRNAAPVAPATSPTPSVTGVSHGKSCSSSHADGATNASTRPIVTGRFKTNRSSHPRACLRVMIDFRFQFLMPVFPIREAIFATPRAHIIRLDLQGHSFPYLAGQAAYLQPQGTERRRPYSIASAPEETAHHGLIEFLVQTGGDGSSRLAVDLL